MILEWLLAINLIGGSVLALDKRRATTRKWRIPESYLHVLELAGGVFLMLPLMYVIRHKNQKTTYYLWSWVIGVGWIILLTWLAHLI